MKNRKQAAKNRRINKQNRIEADKLGITVNQLKARRFNYNIWDRP